MPDRFVDRVRDSVEGLTPGYFALVMASGILSVGMALKHRDLLSLLTLAICGTAFVVLLGLTLWRFVAYRSAINADFLDPRRAFGFFTFVAGTNVLGVRLGMDGHHGATATLLVLAGTAWLVLGYVVPWTGCPGTPAPTRPGDRQRHLVHLGRGQPVGGDRRGVARTARGERPRGPRAAGCGVLVGGGLPLRRHRRVRLAATGALRLRPGGNGPRPTGWRWAAWRSRSWPAPGSSRWPMPLWSRSRGGLIAGLAVVFWAFATWLIPVLVAAGWWRHVSRRVPLRYEATQWSIVFPLGMYGVAGIYLGQANHLPLVGRIAGVELWIAFAAGALVFSAMVHHVIGTVFVATPHPS